MANVSRGGGARRVRRPSPSANIQRQALPSSEELVNLAASRPVAAAVGEFGSLANIANEFYRPKKYKNLAGEAIGTASAFGIRGLTTDEYPDLISPAYEYIDARGNSIDTSVFRQSYDIDDDTGEVIVPGMKGPQEDESELPARITVVPTSTSNPQRPRTVAAGYDLDRQVLTVVFRDGTWYNYYEVTANEWKAFKAAVSKGRYIYKILDYKPRGNASVQGVASGVRKNLYAISRAAQIGMRGKQRKTK